MPPSEPLVLGSESGGQHVEVQQSVHMADVPMELPAHTVDGAPLAAVLQPADTSQAAYSAPYVWTKYGISLVLLFELNSADKSVIKWLPIRLNTRSLQTAHGELTGTQ